MHKGLRIALSYCPPLLILAFLLLTNLFTRNESLRTLLFPEQTLTVSAAYADDGENTDNAMPHDTLQEALADSSGCRHPRYILARDSANSRHYEVALALYQAVLDSGVCERATVCNALGIVRLRMRDWKAAESNFTDAILADSSIARAWYNRALCRSRLNRRADARHDYLAAISRDPSMGNAYFNVGVLSMRRNQWAPARRYFTQALEWGADKPSCYYNMGLALQSEDSTDQALELYRQSIRFNPAATAARLQMAKIWIDRHELDSADTVMNQAARIDPKNCDIRLRLARIAADRKNFDRALTNLDEAERLAPGLAAIAYERARIFGLKGEDRRALAAYEKIMASDPNNPRVYYNIGVNLMDLGKVSQALAAYTRALKADPSYWRAAYNLGVYYLRHNQPSEAIAYFTCVVQANPERPQPQYNLGLAYLKTNDLTMARKSFAHALALDSNHIESRFNLGMTLMKDGLNDSAAAVFTSVLNYKPDHAKSYYNLGILTKRMGYTSRADSLFTKAIACRGGNYPSAWYNRALCQKKLGNFSDALVSLQHTAMPGDSDQIFAKAILLKAELFDTLGMADSAAGALRLADSLNTGDPDALEDLANFYTRHNDIPRMRSVYQRILTANPQNIAILLAAADLEETRHGAPDTALAYYQRIITLDDQNITALVRYGQLLRSMKRFDEALRELQSAIALDPGSITPRLQLMLCFADLEKPQEYQHELRKLRSLTASRVREAYEIGHELSHEQRYPDAVWFLEEAARGQPRDQNIRYDLALCRGKIAATGFDPHTVWKSYCADFPGDARGWYQLAVVLQERGATADAAKAFTTSLAIKPIKDVRYLLARASLALGDRATAMEQIKRFIADSPNDKKGQALYAEIVKK
jgi:tetratricopeptide (TPR) repeat protein